jgi:arylsulfatase A-like enzyme
LPLAAAPLVAALLGTGCRGPGGEEQYPLVADLRRELAAAERDGEAGEGAEDPRCHALAERHGGAVLRAGRRLTLFVEAPPGAALRLGRLARCAPAGAGAASLRVSVASDEAAAAPVQVPVPAAAATVPLPLAGGPLRVDLRLAAERGAAVLLGGLALGARGAGSPPAAVPAVRAVPRRPHLLLYLVDALRRDALGAYGAPGGGSPHLDRLAAEGVLFEDAVAQASWTRTAVASLFTGIDPGGHRVLTRRDALSPSANTLAERLAAGGYRTAAFLGNGNVSGKLGFRQGFERMRQKLGPRDLAPQLTAELLAWLDETRGDPRPFFAYVHTIDPHGPYLPPEPFRSRFAPGVPLELGSRRSLRLLAGGEVAAGPQTARQLRALYQAEVASNDEAFGRLRVELERRGLWRDLVVLAISDHGEEFLEHGGLEHGQRLHAESLDIPLLLRLPEGPAGRRVARLARQVDVMPTLLELAGLPVPAGLDGASLLPALAGAGPRAPVAARSHLHLEGAPQSAVTTSRHRLIVITHPDGRRIARLYDRRRDPAERRDLAAALPITARYLQSVLRWPTGAGAATAAPPLDPEDAEQLRALGYVN